MRGAILGAVCLALASCGSVYVSQDVPTNDPDVEVVPLTPAVIKVANFDSYQPRGLPGVFFIGADTSVSARGAGPMPDPVFQRQSRPGAPQMRIPPEPPRQPYRIGVGDVLILATPQAGTTVEELTGLLAAQNRRQGYTVQDDGAIAIPDVGRIQVASMTLEEAEAELFQALVARQIDPSFSVEISEFNSQRVTVGGAVGNPAVIPIKLTDLTLEEAIAAAGGIALSDEDFASIRLYREGSLFQIPLSQYYRRADLQKTRLVTGDSVFVDTEFDLDRAEAYFQEQIALAQFRQASRNQALAELTTELSIRRAILEEQRANFEARLSAGAVPRDYVYLTGEVVRPSRFPLPFEQQASLSDALYSEGGFSNQTANPSQVYLLRGKEDGGTTAFNLDLANASNQVLATQMLLRPNDVIFVAEQPITRWNRSIQQIFPSLLPAAVNAVAN